MIPYARPIKLIHVSAFHGSLSLWSRWITHASDDRSLQKRLQLPSGNPHCIRHNSQKMVSSAHRCGTVSSASPLSSVVSPSRTSVGPFTPPLNRGGVQSHGSRKSIDSIFASQSSVLNRFRSSCPSLHTTVPRVRLQPQTEGAAVACAPAASDGRGGDCRAHATSYGRGGGGTSSWAD